MRVLVAVGGLLLVGAAYFAIFGGDYDVLELHRIRGERAAEEARAADTRAEVERLRARRDSLLHDSATIERVARERYGMIRDGERLYRFAEPPAAASGEDPEPDSPWWSPAGAEGEGGSGPRSAPGAAPSAGSARTTSRN